MKMFLMFHLKILSVCSYIHTKLKRLNRLCLYMYIYIFVCSNNNKKLSISGVGALEGDGQRKRKGRNNVIFNQNILIKIKNKHTVLCKVLLRIINNDVRYTK